MKKINLKSILKKTFKKKIKKNKNKKTLIKVKKIKFKKKTKRSTKPTKTIKEAYTYATNQTKWKEAREWCADRQLEFKVITEKELGIK